MISETYHSIESNYSSRCYLPKTKLQFQAYSPSVQNRPTSLSLLVMLIVCHTPHNYHLPLPPSASLRRHLLHRSSRRNGRPRHGYGSTTAKGNNISLWASWRRNYFFYIIIFDFVLNFFFFKYKTQFFCGANGKYLSFYSFCFFIITKNLLLNMWFHFITILCFCFVVFFFIKKNWFNNFLKFRFKHLC